MKCPNCGLTCPPDSERCDCGYDFKAHSVRGSYLPSQAKPPDPELLSRVYSLLAVDVVAILVTLVAVVAFRDSTFTPLNRDVGYLTHLVAGTLNLLFLRRLLIAGGRPWLAITIWFGVTLFFCVPAEWAILVFAIRDLKATARRSDPHERIEQA